MNFVQENLVYFVIAILALVIVIPAVRIFLHRSRNTQKELLKKDAQPQITAQTVEDAEIISDIPLTDEEMSVAEATVQARSIEYETPESVPSRMKRLRARLANGGLLGKSILAVLSRADLSASDWEEIEETLLLADVGLDATTEILENLQREIKITGATDSAVVTQLLREQLLKAVKIDASRDLRLCVDTVESQIGETAERKLPASILMVGVNGTGKTTTTGKLARLLVAEGRKVVLGAADTFRAAAAEQLQTWGDRVDVPVVRAEKENADPAAVAFDAVKVGIENKADVVIVDTAGRLQNKANLMDELSKIKRVMEKQAPVQEILLVLDATTGQNGLQQAKVFAQAVHVTGIVLSKLDGTAKGGIVISVQRELGVPVKFIGLGEGPDDLAPFEAENFVDSLLS